MKIVLLSAVLLSAACSSESAPMAREEYETRIKEIMRAVENYQASFDPSKGSPAEQIGADIENHAEALSQLEAITPPPEYEAGHEHLARYFEKSVELYEFFADAEMSGVSEADFHDRQLEMQELFRETFTELEAAGRDLPFLRIGDVVPPLEPPDPSLIPDLRPAEIHYEVRLRDGERIPVTVTYTRPDGSDQTVQVQTPWSSPSYTFEIGSTMRFRAKASTSPPSFLDCVFVAEDPKEGQYVYGPQGDLTDTECFGEYELGLWPPNDDDPINNPLIKVG